jgi:type II secretory pathway component PulF
MARISTRHLARLCHNLGTGLHAGLDVRRVWENEYQRSPQGAKSYFDDVRHRISEGDSLASCFKASNGFFPPLFCEMVEVGERTGRLERVFQRLAEHYEQVIVLRRNFLTGIAWPMFQLIAGVIIIGLLIWILGAIGGEDGRSRLSIFGLYGAQGSLVWFVGVALVTGFVVAPIIGIQKGWLDPGPLFRLLLHVPGVGKGLTTISMSRLTWALSMATDSDLPPDKAVELAVKSTQNSYYTEFLEQMRLAIRRGGEMHDAFRSTGRYPDDFLDALQTGELSGRVSETLQILSKDYDERAKMWYRGLAVACGMLVFFMVAAVMIFLIFQVAQIYLGTLNEALEPI